MDNFFLFYPKTSKFKDLQLRYCGYENCAPDHSYGPAVRDSYLLHIIMKGKGHYLVNQQRYELGQGDGFLIEPGMQTYYEADPDQPWTYIWVGFDGNGAPGCIHDLGLDREIMTFHSMHLEELKKIVLTMLEHRSSSNSDQYMNQSLMYGFFGTLMKDLQLQLAPRERRNELVTRATEYIEENYAQPMMKVSEVAKKVNIERGYLYALFKKYLNLSPQEYLTRLRLTKATELLNHTDFSIDKIAAACGYQDSAIFSKAFKKMFGMPPSKYRQTSYVHMRNSFPGKKAAEISDPDTADHDITF